MSQVRYMVKYNGRRMTVNEFSELSGLPYSTLVTRMKRGTDFYAPISAVDTGSRSDTWVGNYYKGYTFEELADLYKNFAGQENELRMVMDFTGTKKYEAKEILKRLRENAENNRKGYCA